MHEPASDLRRLQQALREQWGLAGTDADLATLAGLQKALRAGQWKVTAAVRKGRDIVALMPGFPERAYGVAIDVGSTTIAAHLTDLDDRRGRRRRRGDEPADPVRRGPDEPGLLRHDEPGRRQGADAGSARGAWTR